MNFIGFDTSNYTTSIAYFNGTDGLNCSKLLPVKEGELGLRQSDAVFHHTKSLQELSGRLFSDLIPETIAGVGVSTRPREVAGSYMPCFMVGTTQAILLAQALHVPYFEFSHQQGHIAAAAWSANRMDLMDKPFLAWHLSGGTTELLLVEPHMKNVVCTKVGGTTDISAGQLIDRTGQLLNLPFPSGKHLDMLSAQADSSEFFSVKCTDLEFSLSGVQNKVQDFYRKNSDPTKTAAYALRSVACAVYKATENAQKHYSNYPVMFSGGVASNSMLREILKPLNPIFAQPQYSTDNAMGIAILTRRSLEG